MDDDNVAIALDPKKLNQVKILLSEFLGVSKDDINLDDSIKDDLHMDPAQITDFLEILDENGFPTHSVNLQSIETLQELFEQLIDDEL
ncbi:MAG TPA: phosphopantetheine-binding protein [Patescibacteria group bacterium]|nr:phosphopantetheine-binding protein [Patescibacteria group bacterium]